MIGVVTTRSVCIQTACSSAALVPGLAMPDWQWQRQTGMERPHPQPLLRLLLLQQHRLQDVVHLHSAAEVHTGLLGFQTLPYVLKHAFPKPGHTGARQQIAHTKQAQALSAETRHGASGRPLSGDRAHRHCQRAARRPSDTRAYLRWRRVAAVAGANRGDQHKALHAAARRLLYQVYVALRAAAPASGPGCAPGAVHPQACIGG